MYKELKFVQGAVSKKEIVQGMKHFAIEAQTVRAYNGSLALCTPLPIDIDCKPNATQFVNAISNCNENHPVTVSMTTGGRLRIQNGPYRALIDCIEEETPHVKPSGEIISCDGSIFRKAFKNVSPFISNDASRPWTNGVLLSRQSAFATNNVTVVQYWLGTELPFTVNVPADAVREVLRIGEDPIHIQLCENSITFHFDNGKWVWSKLLETKWPDIERILNVESNPVELPSNFFDGLESIDPFIDKLHNVYFRNGALWTSMSDDLGASFELEDFPYHGCYSMPMLQLLKGTVTKIDFTLYPNPCIFYGEMLRGAIIGRKIAGET